jgi:hypothetical protein
MMIGYIETIEVLMMWMSNLPVSYSIAVHLMPLQYPKVLWRVVCTRTVLD